MLLLRRLIPLRNVLGIRPLRVHLSTQHCPACTAVASAGVYGDGHAACVDGYVPRVYSGACPSFQDPLTVSPVSGLSAALTLLSRPLQLSGRHFM